jgi:hypothetical protein
MPRHLTLVIKGAVVRWHVGKRTSHGVRAARHLVAGTLALAISNTACDSLAPRDTNTVAGTVTLVNRVRAEVRCTTATACESRLEAALRPRLEPAAIRVNRDSSTIDLTFERTASVFSSASFRQAVTEAGGEVTMLGIDACGTISQSEGNSWLTSGSTRLLLDGAGSFITGTEICVTGELRDQMSPPKLVPRKLVE